MKSDSRSWCWKHFKNTCVKNNISENYKTIKKIQIPDSSHRLIERKTHYVLLETIQVNTIHVLHSMHAGGFLYRTLKIYIQHVLERRSDPDDTKRIETKSRHSQFKLKSRFYHHNCATFVSLFIKVF